MAARFDAAAAQQRGQNSGDGTPIQLTIPTDHPWVPLRILGLGLEPDRLVQADVFLLTDDRPQLLAGGPGSRARPEPARVAATARRSPLGQEHGLGSRRRNGCRTSRSTPRPATCTTTSRHPSTGTSGRRSVDAGFTPNRPPRRRDGRAAARRPAVGLVGLRLVAGGLRDRRGRAWSAPSSLAGPVAGAIDVTEHEARRAPARPALVAVVDRGRGRRRRPGRARAPAGRATSSVQAT